MYQALMRQISLSREDSDPDSDLKCGGLSQDISEEKNIGMCPREYPYDHLVKNVTTFWPCLKIMTEAI